MAIFIPSSVLDTCKLFCHWCWHRLLWTFSHELQSYWLINESFSGWRRRLSEIKQNGQRKKFTVETILWISLERCQWNHRGVTCGAIQGTSLFSKSQIQIYAFEFRFLYKCVGKSCNGPWRKRRKLSKDSEWI